ncbi:hypothetical protein EJ04DRAFT_29483 [Polyplosphaeria fusca]|uniref:Uncharacterized protein n=1 Tax=Polyplosphaeria fusca TaxID=682080 RepID=A0A9P4UZ85_9PLEO|nr:hypothetical protein EJ04DRAFT_29483 [Polyplosphaeria fusca]
MRWIERERGKADSGDVCVFMRGLWCRRANLRVCGKVCEMRARQRRTVTTTRRRRRAFGSAHVSVVADKCAIIPFPVAVWGTLIGGLGGWMLVSALLGLDKAGPRGSRGEGDGARCLDVRRGDTRDSFREG